MRHASECNLCDGLDRGECGRLLINDRFENAAAQLVEKESAAIHNCCRDPSRTAVTFVGIGAGRDHAQLWHFDNIRPGYAGGGLP
jgi:hypothetical protein